MSNANESAKFALEVIMNKDKNRVLFAEADSQFVDVLLSFLTLPLGGIINILEMYYEDKAPTIGSLNSLYHSLKNLDSSHFVTGGAKNTLLKPKSSFEAEYLMLKLNIRYLMPAAQYFSWSHFSGHSYRCTYSGSHNMFSNVSIYYKSTGTCSLKCRCRIISNIDKRGCQAASVDGVFTTRRESFIISDDLQIFPSVTGLFQIITTLGITDMDEAEPITVIIGFDEIMSLLKASFISSTPLSDLILSKERKMNSVIGKYSWLKIETLENPNSKKIILKVVIQESSGGAEQLLAGKTSLKAVDNLYRSITDLIDDEYFTTKDMRNRLVKPTLPHGCLSEDYILPLTEECLPAEYTYDPELFSHAMFPKGKGTYLDGPRTYVVTDDLTVTPFCISSILSSLKEQKIPISDVKEVNQQIGLKEGLRILKASLSSTSALSDALLKDVSNKRPKREV